ncbi:nucleotide modification associated domain-containing protein [Megamonas sp.]|uniref:nucleotide modification associated domain-containing protein n=1 Tax=Megamonas sp. TaxID=2049033 RepID=UPI002587C53E|nr:nucleotide modification associated domain-containing protein [Megamonas sp.]
MADLVRQIKEVYILVDGFTDDLFQDVKFTQFSEFYKKNGTMFFITGTDTLIKYHKNSKYTNHNESRPYIFGPPPKWVLALEDLFFERMRYSGKRYAAVILDTEDNTIEFLSNSLDDLVNKIVDILKDHDKDKDPSEERFKEIALSLSDLYSKKNPVYGNSFERSLKKYGKISGLTRISDKFNRLEKIITNPDIETNDESLEDTLLDLASYCIMMKMALENANETNS